MSKGYSPKPITENELNEMRNLRKKVDYLKSKLEESGALEEPEENSDNSNDEGDDDHEPSPKKKNV